MPLGEIRPSLPWGQIAQVLRTDVPPAVERSPNRPIRNWRPILEDEGLHVGRWLVVAAVVAACIAFAWIVL